MKFLARLAILSLVAAAFAVLTGIYGRSVHPPLPYARFQAAHRHPPPAPNPSKFMDFVRYAIAITMFTVGGRVALRLRLTPPPRDEGQPILLGLSQRESL